MVSPLRMQPPHFHSRQSSRALVFLALFCVKKKKGGKKAAWLTEYGSHKGQLGGMEKKKKKCVRAHVYAGGTTVCFVKRRDGNKAMGVKLS